MSLLVDQWVPEGTCSQVLRSTSVDSWRLRASKFSVLKLIEIVILWVYYTIPFCFSLLLALSGNHFNFWNNFVWLRITDEGSLPEMRIWSILLIKSVLKWCIHLSGSLFYYCYMINLVFNKMEETFQSNTLDWSNLVLYYSFFPIFSTAEFCQTVSSSLLFRSWSIFGTLIVLDKETCMCEFQVNKTRGPDKARSQSFTML